MSKSEKSFSSPQLPSNLEKCEGGCSFWDCGRELNHPGPCQPSELQLLQNEGLAVAEFDGRHVQKRPEVNQVLLFQCECGNWVTHGSQRTVRTEKLQHNHDVEHWRITAI